MKSKNPQIDIHISLIELSFKEANILLITTHLNKSERCNNCNPYISQPIKGKKISENMLLVILVPYKQEEHAYRIHISKFTERKYITQRKQIRIAHTE